MMTGEYNRGYAAGVASRDAEFEALQRVCDYWYMRACNPNAPSPESKMVNSIIAGQEANEERARKYAELDAIEQAKFAEASDLIAEGYDDIDVATKVGLFVGIVENLRAGTL
jgi:hypothetical protein